MATSGQMMSFQLKSKFNIASVLNAGMASGTAIRVRSVNSLAPSSRAASKYSRGSVSKKVRIKKVPKDNFN